MASADKISDGAVQSVAGQLAAFLAAPGAPAAGGQEVAESFAVCVIDARSVVRPPADLGALVRPAGQWHHQVRSGGAATHVARSTQGGFGGDEFEVQQTFESPVAAKIDAAIGWADRHVKGRTTVRLLVIPAYFVHAFAVVRDNPAAPAERYTAVLIDQPETYTRLEYEREYPLAEFLKLLAKEKPAADMT